MKPDWNDAPEWANYLEIDDDGTWYWYAEEPTHSRDMANAYSPEFDWRDAHWSNDQNET